MTEKLYDKDSFLKSFTATVVSCEEYFGSFAVVLSQTAFFPEAGGQKSDRGIIGNANVIDVQIADEIITHITDAPLKVGETVEGVLDFERRFDFMQQHSGEHIVSGVAHSLYGCENVGFHLSEDIVTLDFDKPLEKYQIAKIEESANEAVFKNVNFYTYYPDDETIKNLKYRSKKELDGAIRIVEIEDTDMCACCAPHVKTSGQIGLIKLMSVERLRGGVRIEIKCGKRALVDYCETYESIHKISATLCTKHNEAANAVDRLLDQISELKYKYTGLKRQMLLEKVEALKPQSDITAMIEDGLEIKDLQTLADSLYKKWGGIRAVLSPIENGYSFAICGEETALSEFFVSFKQKLNVKGGGRGAMVQGTVNASENEILQFFL